MELEEIDEGDLTTRVALQLDLHFRHHQRCRAKIEDVLVQCPTWSTPSASAQTSTMMRSSSCASTSPALRDGGLGHSLWL